jgi:hypothetical protein
MINTMQQIGGSIGIALLSSFAANASAGYLTDHAGGRRAAALAALHSYHTVFWWSAGFFVLCAVVSALVFRTGPLTVNPHAEPAIAH